MEDLSDWPAEEGTHKFLVYSLTEQLLTVDLYDENPYVEEPSLESGILLNVKPTARLRSPPSGLDHESGPRSQSKACSSLNCFNGSVVAVAENSS